jgi:hypothetical protein
MEDDSLAYWLAMARQRSNGSTPDVEMESFLNSDRGWHGFQCHSWKSTAVVDDSASGLCLHVRLSRVPLPSIFLHLSLELNRTRDCLGLTAVSSKHCKRPRTRYIGLAGDDCQGMVGDRFP